MDDPHGFAQAIYNYHLLPERAINPMAIVLPWVELVVGTVLLLGIWTAGASLAASVLLGVFAGALGISLARGLNIACGCFGIEGGAASISALDFIRDLALLGMAIHVLAFDRGLGSAGRWIRKIVRV